MRFFAGVVSALLLVTAGLVVYRGWAADDPIIAAAPPPRLAPEQPVQYGVLEEIAVPKAPAMNSPAQVEPTRLGHPEASRREARRGWEE